MTSIIIPTYNERENIPELFRRIQTTLRDTGESYEVVVVDDDSPDRTWELVRDYDSRFPARVVRRREKRGLATAILRGVQEANDSTIVVMDADLQHPPETIPELTEAVRSGTDLVIGSRFTAGGSIRKFSTPRILISRGAAVLARTMLSGIEDVNDILSGFFAFRRSVVTEADLNPIGYKFLLSILVRGKYSSVEEIGFRFDTRNRGRSKLGARNILHFLVHLYRLTGS